MAGASVSTGWAKRSSAETSSKLAGVSTTVSGARSCFFTGLRVPVPGTSLNSVGIPSFMFTALSDGKFLFSASMSNEGSPAIKSSSFLAGAIVAGATGADATCAGESFIVLDTADFALPCKNESISMSSDDSSETTGFGFDKEGRT